MGCAGGGRQEPSGGHSQAEPGNEGTLVAAALLWVERAAGKASGSVGAAVGMAATGMAVLAAMVASGAELTGGWARVRLLAVASQRAKAANTQLVFRTMDLAQVLVAVAEGWFWFGGWGGRSEGDCAAGAVLRVWVRRLVVG